METTEQEAVEVVEAGALPVTRLTTEFVTVGPDLAREWLTRMAPNRKVSRPNLDHIMAAMIEGMWHDDGTPIRFDELGNLIDGQHRLLAVINTGVEQTFLVLRGVKRSAMTTLDTGKTRSKADVLLIHDPTVNDINSVAAATNIILRWVKGERNNNLRNAEVTNDEFIRFYDQEKDGLIEASLHGRKIARATAAASGQAFALCYWLFQEIDAEDAEFFWDRLQDGAALDVGNPIYALREMFAREARAAGTRERMRADIAAALTIKAWNAFREGREIKLLAFKVGGAHPETFPEPV